MVYFPFILLGLEKNLKDGKRGMFGIFLFLSALNNYYFFIGQAVFLLLYFGVRAWSGEWQLNGKKVAGVFLEAALGTCAAGILLLPSFYAVIQNNRTDNFVAGWNALYYAQPQRFWDIIHSFFFPPDIPARPNFFPDANNKWSSMSAWLPMVGATGAIAYFQSRSHTDWLRRLLTVLAICAVIPLFNAMFQLFNAQYYARWFYMFTLMLVVATVKAMDTGADNTTALASPISWRRAFCWSGGVILFFALMIGVLPDSFKPEDGVFSFGREKSPKLFWVYVAIALLGLVAFAVVLRMRRRGRTFFFRVAMIALSAVCLGYSFLMVFQGHRVSVYVPDFVVERAIEGIDKVELPTDESGEFVRIDSPNCLDNLGIFWQRPYINAFHSIVPGSVQEFYESVGVKRSVGSRPETSHYALRSLTSVRYVFDYANNEEPTYEKEQSDNFVDSAGVTKMPGYRYAFETNGFYVYENENYIPMGFTYQDYVTRSEYESLSNDKRELLLLRALVVEDAQQSAVSSLLHHLDVDSQSFTYADFQADCNNRKNGAASTFATTKTDFTATATFQEENILFFSVPYENGWSATVNGQTVEILKADVGFMAVQCPSGECTVQFTYKTPGLAAGALASLGGGVAFFVYWCVFDKLPEPKPRKRNADGTEEKSEQEVL